MTPDSLYAALDEPDADVDYILGLIADWYADRGDERREAAARWMVAMGKRPNRVRGWTMTGNPSQSLPLLHANYDGRSWDWMLWYQENQPITDYYRHAIDALADQWPAVVAEWWERERMVTT